jgi:hypothetical protein
LSFPCDNGAKAMKLTATDFLIDLMRHKHGSINKAELLKKWQKHQWSNDEMRHWANWQWKEMI